MPQGTNRYGFRLIQNKIVIAQHILTINPQEMGQQEPSKANVYETFGGAYADDYGRSPSPSITLSGHTGFRGKEAFQSGQAEFENLRNTIYRNRDLPGAKIIFDNYKDDEHYVVMLMDFQLKKSVANPLVYNYMIPMRVIAPYNNLLPIEDNIVADFFSSSKTAIQSVVNELQFAVNTVNSLLTYPIGIVSEGLSVVLGTTNQVIGILTGFGTTIDNWDVMPLTSMASAIEACENIRNQMFKTPSFFSALNNYVTTGMEQFDNAMKLIGFQLEVAASLPGIYPDQNTIPSPQSVVDTYDKSSDEDLRDIALKLYEDANKWQLIAAMNNITPEEAEAGTSKNLVVPKATYTSIVGQEKSTRQIIQLLIAKGTPVTQTIIENVLFGLDIKNDISISGAGDLAVVSGTENIKQAILNKLNCYTGTLLENSNFGTILDQIVGSGGTPETPNQLKTEITRTLLTDERIDTVDKVEITQPQNDAFDVTIDLSLVGGFLTTVNYQLPKGG